MHFTKIWINFDWLDNIRSEFQYEPGENVDFWFLKIEINFISVDQTWLCTKNTAFEI